MKQFTAILLSLFFFIQSHGQIVFQKGYIIDSSGKKIECLIKNADWKKNPRNFKFKLTEESPELIGNLENTKEFGIDGIFKFANVELDIDMSSDNVQKLTYYKDPVWEKKKVFLRTLRTGEINFYSYEESDKMRFFISKGGEGIKQLIFKSYNNGSTILKNISFKQQLINELNGEFVDKQRIVDLKYDINTLDQFFEEYNNKFETPNVKIQGKVKRQIFECKLTPGISFPNFVLGAGASQYKYEFNPEYRIGIELDAILPFGMNKWSLYVEPTFFITSLKNENTNIHYSDLNLKLLSFPVGVKGKTFLKNKSKIFYDANIDFGFGTSFKTVFENFKVHPSSNYAIGVGYEIKKISLECRYLSNTNIFNWSKYYYSDYQRVQLIFGYKIFGK